jgi:hypothetical protein
VAALLTVAPERATAQLLAHLGLRLPKGPRLIANVVPKITAESTLAPQKKRSAN